MENKTLSLRVADAQSLIDWELGRLIATGMDEMTAQMESWKTSWRKEALDYYLPKGWCFASYQNDGTLGGYIIANVLPFFRGYTQVLWLEHLSAVDDEHRADLMDVITGYAREKHLQMIVAENLALSETEAQNYKVQNIDSTWIQIRTAKNKD